MDDDEARKHWQGVEDIAERLDAIERCVERYEPGPRFEFSSKRAPAACARSRSRSTATRRSTYAAGWVHTGMQLDPDDVTDGHPSADDYANQAGPPCLACPTPSPSRR